MELNQAMVKMLGYESKEELMAIDIKSQLYFQPEDREKAVLKGKLDEMAVFRLRKKDGSEVWVEDHGRYVVDESAKIIYHEGILREITARLKAEEERKQLEDQLFQAQKFESVGTMAAGIAHDFNNTLNIIHGNVELLLTSHDSGEKFKHRLEKITKAANHGSHLVKQLLTFARKTDIVKRSIVVNDLIREVAELVEETFPKSIELSLELMAELFHVVTDSSQIHQVLLNLCVNARDAMPNGGTLIIGTAQVSGEVVRKKFSTAPAGEYVLIAVKDTGFGMDEETRKRIFDPFFTTKNPDKGTGLGLSVVMGIISKHNGFVDVKSVVGKGSEFFIYLPGDSSFKVTP